MRIAKKILGRRRFSRLGIRRYRKEQIHQAHDGILRKERRHGFPSKWS